MHARRRRSHGSQSISPQLEVEASDEENFSSTCDEKNFPVDRRIGASTEVYNRTCEMNEMVQRALGSVVVLTGNAGYQLPYSE